MDNNTLVPHAQELVRRATQAIGEEAFTYLFDSILEQKEMTPEQQQLLASYVAGDQADTPELLAKRDKLADFLNAWRSREEFLLGEAERITVEARQVRNIIKYFESGVHAQMLNWGIRAVKGLLHSYRVKSNPPSVAIDDENVVPKKYRRPPEKDWHKWAVDKEAIKDAFAEGKKVAGARLVTDKTRMEIR